MRYHYYTIPERRQIVCVTHYAKRLVSASAICSPNDTFDEDFGRALAKAKVDLKVANKRLAHAKQRLAESVSAYIQAQKEVQRQGDFADDALKEVQQCQNLVDELVQESYR